MRPVVTRPAVSAKPRISCTSVEHARHVLAGVFQLGRHIAGWRRASAARRPPSRPAPSPPVWALRSVCHGARGMSACSSSGDRRRARSSAPALASGLVISAPRCLRNRRRGATGRHSRRAGGGAGRGRNSLRSAQRRAGRSTISAMRANRLVAVMGLARNSVTPASRAASTRCFSVWPLIMMMGTKGLGLMSDVAHQAGEFDAVHRLHLHVGEHQVALALAQHVQRRAAMRRPRPRS